MIRSFKFNKGLNSGMLSGWSDQLLCHFGCSSVETLDFSDFEGAQFCWNLNESLSIKKENIKKYNLIVVLIILKQKLMVKMINYSILFRNILKIKDKKISHKRNKY
jgi:hypothetical protein